MKPVHKVTGHRVFFHAIHSLRLQTIGAFEYEWETEAEPNAPAEWAISVFVKGSKDGIPVEIISPWYSVGGERPAVPPR